MKQPNWPVHIAQIAGHQLRFFDGAPHDPECRAYVAEEDILAAHSISSLAFHAFLEDHDLAQTKTGLPVVWSAAVISYLTKERVAPRSRSFNGSAEETKLDNLFVAIHSGARAAEIEIMRQRLDAVPKSDRKLEICDVLATKPDDPDGTGVVRIRVNGLGRDVGTDCGWLTASGQLQIPFDVSEEELSRAAAIAQEMWKRDTKKEKLSAAGWCAHEDEEAITLQIELGNDWAITLTCRKSDQPSSCALWYGSGECSFEDQTPESFRGWIEMAKEGPVSPIPPETLPRRAIS